MSIKIENDMRLHKKEHKKSVSFVTINETLVFFMFQNKSGFFF